MNTDIQVIHHLWWLRYFLQEHFQSKEYKDIIRVPLDSDALNLLRSWRYDVLGKHVA